MDLMVCVGSSCHLKNSREVINLFKQLIEENGLESQLTLKGSFCMNKCAEKGVSVSLGDDCFSLELSEVNDFFERKLMGELQRGVHSSKESE